MLFYWGIIIYLLTNGHIYDILYLSKQTKYIYLRRVKRVEIIGQRSQIYVRYNDKDKKGLIANYYGWNCANWMISRARGGIELIVSKSHLSFYFGDKFNLYKLSRTFDTNFDDRNVAISCDIIQEYVEQFSDENFNDCIFEMQDNNDGKLIVDICGSEVKYAFLDRDAHTDSIMNAEAYMCWDCDDVNWRKMDTFSTSEIAICEDNIRYIQEHATLMTREEVIEFLEYDYKTDLAERLERGGAL